jgi:hypothetical protein
MTFVRKLAPLALTLAFTTGGALAAEAVPPEVMQAIDALNLPSEQMTATISQDAAGSTVTVAPAAGTNVKMVDERLLNVGLGAIAGVVVFNLATGGMASVPVLASIGGAEAGTMMGVGRGAVAMSRVYAVSSAVVGGLAGDYLYRKAQAKRMASVPSEVAARITP